MYLKSPILAPLYSYIPVELVILPQHLHASLVQMGHLSSNSPLTITRGEEAMESGTVFLSSRRHWNYYRLLETLCVLD
ncbi:hypothetical protein BDL97_11G052100 [Sphagnum fallax]|nr:hypothetical protein BDL97_11G052100 [Sphagnum fallax]